MRIHLLLPRPGKEDMDIPLSLVNGKTSFTLNSAGNPHVFKVTFDGQTLEVTDYTGKQETFMNVAIGQRFDCKFLTLQLKTVNFALAIREG